MRRILFYVLCAMTVLVLAATAVLVLKGGDHLKQPSAPPGSSVTFMLDTTTTVDKFEQLRISIEDYCMNTGRGHGHVAADPMGGPETSCDTPGTYLPAVP